MTFEESWTLDFLAAADVVVSRFPKGIFRMTVTTVKTHDGKGVCGMSGNQEVNGELNFAWNKGTRT